MTHEVVQAVDVDRIISRPQVRREFDQATLAELAQSIREVGVQQPIQVRKEGDHFVIVFGERRWRAAKLAGLSTIPAIVVDYELSESQVLQRQLIENVQRADLSASDKSRAIQQLMSSADLNASQVAIKLGMSAATVTRLLSLAELPDAILAGVDAGTISLSAAYELSQIADPQRQSELAAETAAGRLTRDALVAAKKSARQPSGVAAKPSPPDRTRVTIPLDADRSVTLAGHGLSTVEQLIEWLEELLGKARRSRTQNLSLSTFVKALKDQAKA